MLSSAQLQGHHDHHQILEEVTRCFYDMNLSYNCSNVVFKMKYITLMKSVEFSESNTET